MRELKQILLMTHGRFCEAILESTEMIVGKIQRIETFPLLSGMSPEEYADAVAKHLEAGDGGAYILSDIQGGTPYNVAGALSKRYEVEVFAGLNMPMLIALDDLRQQGREGRRVVKELLLAATESIRHLERQSN